MSTPQTFSIQQQIEEVEREIALRKTVYPRRVQNGQMRQSVADYHRARMEAVLRTLEWSRDNRPAVIEWIKSKRGEAA